MGEMAQAETEVYATRSVQVWKTVLNWLAFFFHIFLQIVRGTPSLAQVFSYIGLGHQSLLPSDSSSFKPLPVVELPESPESAAALEITAGALAVPDESDHLPIQRLTVVLDLDETLVCAYETSSLPAIVHHQATEAGLKWFELDCLSSEKDREGKPKVNHVTVFERPGLGEFLKQLSEFADLVLFTAGLEGYARPLVDRIDFDNRFSHRLYRPSTISTGGMGMCFSIPLTGTACVAVNLIGMKPGTPFLRDACTDAGLPLFCILKKDNLDAGHYQLVFQMKWNMESFVLDFFRNNTYRPVLNVFHSYEWNYNYIESGN
ncbi:uncharacterized protein LOC127806137 isoform X1 [Diospyros lotus]|uniref:uncharacterized protein LOC127806137 isoform X1 n=1 Tax=Diospyros lotus TaxID=55363 RepID=UPI00225C2DE5|nr:uncharacterized protein LOC127806137 isoform X1 [Diospyros lotus]